MNHGNSSKYTKSAGFVEEGFVNKAWTPPLS